MTYSKALPCPTFNRESAASVQATVKAPARVHADHMGIAGADSESESASLPPGAVDTEAAASADVAASSFVQIEKAQLNRLFAMLAEYTDHADAN